MTLMPYMELTGADDGLSHRISDMAHREGLVRSDGRYEAACGRTVLASSMFTVPGRPCRSCFDAIRKSHHAAPRQAGLA